MTYPGNPTLAPEIRERVVSTFRNSLKAVKDGKDQEAILGCEFVLRMDPDFVPATNLIDQIKSGKRPADGNGPESSPAPAPSSGLGTVIQDLLQRRNFQQVLQIAQSQSAAIQKEPALLQMVQTAQERLESEEFVLKFLEGARTAQAAGNTSEAAALIEKARSLDPDHPEIASFDAAAAPEPVFAEAEPISSPGSAEASGPGDLMALQQQSLDLGDEDDDGLLSLDDDDDLADLDDDLEALDLGGDLETLDEDPGDSTNPIGSILPELEAPEEAEDLADLNASDGDDLEDLEDLDDFGDLEQADDLLDLDAGADVEDDAGTFDDLGALPDSSPSADMTDLGAEAPLDFLDDGDDLDIVDGMDTPASTPAPTTTADPEGDDDASTIRRLLAEGREAFDREEFQSAIDVWSRIFLIDIDNGEASGLIEEARKKKAELERQAEELFHEAEDQIESQELETAKATLARVLELHPDHPAARAHLDQLEAGKVPTVTRRSAEEHDPFDELGGGEGMPAEEDQQSMDAAVQRDRIVVVKKTDKKLVGAAVAGLVVVLGGGGFLISQWDSLFPNTEAPAVAPVPQVDSIQRARQLQDEGRTQNAIAVLRKVQPDDAAYSEAQTLIGEWTALIEDESSPEGPSEEILARREVLLKAAREAFDERRHLIAHKYFDRAHRVFPLDADDLSMKRECEDRLAPLQSEIDGFGIGEYEQILPSLWRRHEANPHDLNVRRLMVDSYYNLALRDLQRGDPGAAYAKIEEAIALEPENDELKRLSLFADTYRQRSPDVIYRIYVKYVPSKS